MRYIVATRRELRGKVKPAVDVVSSVANVVLAQSSDPERILIESDRTLEELQSDFGRSYYVEREISYQSL